ncbi:MAG: Fe-S oxidoreductase [Desulfotomaculum sp. 46_80]|nr:MAG: Fe-S oxidoreductase [Desulfotomaculum sp. 46_80]
MQQPEAIAAFLLLVIVSVLAFLYALSWRVGVVTLGEKENRLDSPGQRFGNFIMNVFAQRRLLAKNIGIVHFFIFWGFIFICLGEIPLLFEGLFGIKVLFFSTNPIFITLQNLIALIVVIVLLVAVYRRWVLKPDYLYRTSEAAIIVILIFGVVITEWFATAARLAIEPNPAAAFAPAYSVIAAWLSGYSKEVLEKVSVFFWWVHMLILFGFLVYIPNSKHMHLLFAPLNAFFASLEPRGAQIRGMNLEDEEATEFGVGRIEQFTWKQLLDSLSCGECGRCMDNCPANLSKKPLNPKKLLSRQLKEHMLEKGTLMLKKGLFNTGEEAADQVEKVIAVDKQAAEVLEKSLIGDVVTEDEIWACTTCFSCQEQCPVSNEHVAKMVDMRRYLVMMESSIAPELQLAFRNVEKNSNPWGVGWANRGEWAKDLDVKLMSDDSNVEYLYWVGCAGSFDDRAKKVATAVVEILKAAGINFAILGAEEKCCGDFIRRAGNEYLYQSLVMENVETLNGYGVTKIITACPHCLNTLKNEYPAFGGKYEVIHHTQLINQLVSEGKLSLNKSGGESQRVVYHDSCYLGRYQQEYVAPRAVLQMVPGVQLVEMDRNRSTSFCCGAGGGRMWMEEHLGDRINNMRTEQALSKNPQLISANCPFCITMLEDGVKVMSDPDADPIKVMDPAELIAKLLH